MRREFSAYLDAVRFSAAMAVVIAHFTFPAFIAGVPYQGALAGLAVTVFFVLSGYVIAYVVDQKERTLREFAVSRLARIYSVAIPAIILTIAIDLYMLHRGVGDRVPLYEYRGIWKYLPVFLTFTSEIGPIHAPVFTDGVFWSLSYEVWYYIVFALFVYLRGVPRIILGLTGLAILGLPALIYFPVWLFGGLCYRLHQKTEISQRVASVGAIATAVLAIGLWVSGSFDRADLVVHNLLGGRPEHLHNSMNFPSHYIAGLVTAVHFYFIRYCKLSFLAGSSVRKIVTYLASFTFAIYLAHRPLMNLWRYLLQHDPHSIFSIAVLFCVVMVCVWGFGLISEHRKGWWKDIFRRMVYRTWRQRIA